MSLHLLHGVENTEGYFCHPSWQKISLEFMRFIHFCSHCITNRKATSRREGKDIRALGQWGGLLISQILVVSWLFSAFSGSAWTNPEERVLFKVNNEARACCQVDRLLNILPSEGSWDKTEKEMIIPRCHSRAAQSKSRGEGLGICFFLERHPCYTNGQPKLEP